MKTYMFLFVTLLSSVAMAQDLALEKAKKTIEKTPDDPAANLVLATFHASRAEWDAALTHFGKAKKQEINAALEAEKKADDNQFTAVEIGDAWAKAIPKSNGARQACLDRASWWYAKAWAKLDDFGKMKLRERLAKLYRPANARQAVMPEKWGGPVDPMHKLDALSPVVHSDNAAFKLVPGAKAKNASFLRSPTIGLPKGKVVEFSAWVLSDGTDSFDDAIRFSVADASGKPLQTKALSIPTDTPVWTRLSERVELGDAPGRASIEVVSFSVKGFVVVDDFSLRVDGVEVLKGGSFE